jgi:hypothetical protein
MSENPRCRHESQGTASDWGIATCRVPDHSSRLCPPTEKMGASRYSSRRQLLHCCYQTPSVIVCRITIHCVGRAGVGGDPTMLGHPIYRDFTNEWDSPTSCVLSGADF